MAQDDPFQNVMVGVYLLLFVVLMLWILYTIGMFFISLFPKKKSGLGGLTYEQRMARNAVRQANMGLL